MRVKEIKDKSQGIYCILNLVNQKLYVGSSKNMRQRLYKHRYQLRRGLHENAHLQSSFTKYGENNYHCFVIDYYADNLIEQEQYWIDLLNADYNIVRKVVTCEPTMESRKKISDTLKAGYLSGRVARTRMRPVCQYSIDKQLLGRWDCMADAGRAVGVGMKTIFKVVSGQYQTWRGTIWKYEDDVRPLPTLSLPLKGSNVILTDTHTGESNFFPSLTSACKHLGIHVGTLTYTLNHGSLYKERYSIAKAH